MGVDEYFSLNKESVISQGLYRRRESHAVANCGVWFTLSFIAVLDKHNSRSKLRCSLPNKSSLVYVLFQR